MKELNSRKNLFLFSFSGPPQRWAASSKGSKVASALALARSGFTLAAILDKLPTWNNNDQSYLKTQITGTELLFFLLLELTVNLVP